MTRTTVLLLEDNPGDARLLREALIDAPAFDHALEIVDRVSAALDALGRMPVDIVLLDLSLPDATGLVGLRKIHGAHPEIPVVVMTGSNNEALAIEAMQAGAQDYLVKGEASSALIARSIRYAIERARSERQARTLVRAQAAHAAANAERIRLQSLFAQAPAGICVVMGPTLRFDLANARFLEMFGKRGLVGTPLLESIPEIAGQGFEELVHRVMASGEACTAKEMPCKLRRDGGPLVEVIFDFAFEPLRDADGTVEGVMVVATDVTEQVRAIRSRDDLLATVSHDLRGPLTTISLAVELLQAGETAPRSAKQVTAIARATTRMEQLIRDLLDMASIESGHLSVDKRALVVGDLVEEAVELIQPAATAKVLALETQLAAAKIPVHCDRGRVLQVFSNILGNAVKFTPSSGKISVRVREPDANFVKFAITDTGPGIDPEQLPFVFDRFWQAKETARAGTGLGLAICKGIIHQHGGSIWVESQVGIGTTFFFTLPIAAPAL